MHFLFPLAQANLNNLSLRISLGKALQLKFPLLPANSNIRVRHKAKVSHTNTNKAKASMRRSIKLQESFPLLLKIKCIDMVTALVPLARMENMGLKECCLPHFLDSGARLTDKGHLKSNKVSRVNLSNNGNLVSRLFLHSKRNLLHLR